MKNRMKIKELTLIALFTGIIVICSFISLPILTVPFTLQLFGIYSALYLLGGKGGGLSVLVYLLLGATGLPVFSGLRGGIGAFFDLRGGFLWGFIALSLVYFFVERLLGKGLRGRIIATALSLTVFYTLGVLWYTFTYLGEFSRIGYAILTVCLPYLPLDFIKIAVAMLLSERLKPYIKFSLSGG